MCMVLVSLKLKIRVKVAVVLGVLDEDVLLHPEDDFEGFRNPKIRILLEKLACRHVYCPRVPNESEYRGRGASYDPHVPGISCKITCPE